MVRTTFTGIAAAASVTILIAAAAPQNQPTQDNPATAADAGPRGDEPAIALTGCLELAADGRAYVLARAQPSTAGTASSTVTGPTAGTSATGAAPSGSVTGDTPTGSTATTTAAPTPAAGEPDASANPASPTYSQGTAGAGTPGTAGTTGTGTVAGPDTAPGTSTHDRYALSAGAGVDFAPHVGHTVELKGKLKPVSRSEGQPSGTEPEETAARLPVLEVRSMTHRAATCNR